ncbi:MAG: STAS domain-containing protein [Saccharothrix sp.]|nr:STAS domain-containing protein [Saccharothrix sp.]
MSTMDLLRISSRRRRSWTVVELDGELDIASSAALGDALDDAAEDRHPARVVVDLSPLDFCDASGLSALVDGYRSARERDGELRLVCPEGLTRRLLRITELTDLMPVFDTVDEAVADTPGQSAPPDPEPPTGARGGAVMITEIAIERVEFLCGNCWHAWSVDFDVQHYRDEIDQEWEYFSRDGVPAPSPYDRDGAPPCARCGHRWIGRLVARRQLPLVPGSPDTPRNRLDADGERAARHAAPHLSAEAHEQPRHVHRLTPVGQE